MRTSLFSINGSIFVDTDIDYVLDVAGRDREGAKGIEFEYQEESPPKTERALKLLHCMYALFSPEDATPPSHGFSNV